MSSHLLIKPLVVFFKLCCKTFSCSTTKACCAFVFFFLSFFYFDLNYETLGSISNCYEHCSYVSETVIALHYILECHSMSSLLFCRQPARLHKIHKWNTYVHTKSGDFFCMWTHEKSQIKQEKNKQ